MTANVLNPVLYQALYYAAQAGRFGHRQRTVRIIRAGLRNRKSKHFDVRSNRHFWKIDTEGEGYQVCCPFCRDTKYRLHFNHEWGVLDPELNTHNYFMANCFNEQCHKQDFFLEQIRYRLQLNTGVAFHINNAMPVIQARPVEYQSPGICEPMNVLCRRDPNHPAVQLLVGRGYNPDLLGYYWGVSYCHQGAFPFSDNRIIFPVSKAGKPVGWQARYVGHDGKGNTTGLHFCYRCGYMRTNDGSKLHTCPGCNSDRIRVVPKYWTMPGMSTSENALNWEVANTWPFVATTEGPLDPIRLGRPEMADVPGPGMCCFGHTLSGHHRRLILESNKKLVLLYDSDVWAHTCELAAELRGFISCVLPVQLPPNEDPGSTPHSLLWQTIKQHAFNQRVDLGI